MGLALNLARAEMRRAAGTLLAVQQAMSTEGIGEAWFAALAGTSDEARATHAEYEAMRQVDAAHANHEASGR